MSEPAVPIASAAEPASSLTTAAENLSAIVPPSPKQDGQGPTSPAPAPDVPASAPASDPAPATTPEVAATAATAPTRESLLLPIKIDLTYGEVRLRESFLWPIEIVKPVPMNGNTRDYSSAINEPTIRSFARRMCEDLDLDIAFDKAVADHMKQQIIRFYDEYIKEWTTSDPDIQAFEQHVISTMSPQSASLVSEMGSDEQFRSSRLRDRNRRRGPDERDPRADLFERDDNDDEPDPYAAAATQVYGLGDGDDPLSRIDDESAIAHANSEEGAEGAPKRVIPKDTEEQRVLLKVDIALAGIEYRDSIEWDLTNPASDLDVIARVAACDMGLSREFEQGLAMELRRLALFHATYQAKNKILAQIAAKHGMPRPPYFLPLVTMANAIRDLAEATNYQPILFPSNPTAPIPTLSAFPAIATSQAVAAKVAATQATRPPPTPATPSAPVQPRVVTTASGRQVRSTFGDERSRRRIYDEDSDDSGEPDSSDMMSPKKRKRDTPRARPANRASGDAMDVDMDGSRSARRVAGRARQWDEDDEEDLGDDSDDDGDDSDGSDYGKRSRRRDRKR